MKQKKEQIEVVRANSILIWVLSYACGICLVAVVIDSFQTSSNFEKEPILRLFLAGGALTIWLASRFETKTIAGVLTFLVFLGILFRGSLFLWYFLTTAQFFPFMVGIAFIELF